MIVAAEVNEANAAMADPNDPLARSFAEEDALRQEVQSED